MPRYWKQLCRIKDRVVPNLGLVHGDEAIVAILYLPLIPRKTWL